MGFDKVPFSWGYRYGFTLQRVNKHVFKQIRDKVIRSFLIQRIKEKLSSLKTFDNYVCLGLVIAMGCSEQNRILEDS